MSILFVQGPGNILIQLLDGGICLLGDMAHDAVDHFALVVALLALDNVLRRHSTLGQVNVSLFLVHPQHHHDFVAADADELLNRTNAAARQFGEQNHAVNVVVFQQFDICAHFGDLLDIDHDKRVDFRIFLLVEPTVGERHVGGLVSRLAGEKILVWSMLTAASTQTIIQSQFIQQSSGVPDFRTRTDD